MDMHGKRIIYTLIIIFSGIILTGVRLPGDNPPKGNISGTPGVESILWAKSVLDTLTLDEKLGQLFMVPAWSNKGTEHTTSILKLILEEKVGGIIMMQGGPMAQTRLVNTFQLNSDLPLMISQDAEWGPSMRLDSAIRFPRNLVLGAVQDDQLVYRLGLEIAKQCKATGVQVNFSPVADINNNPKNPVINDRSFGEDRDNVTRKSIQMMRGLQDGGVLACAKHFPGHGDTDTDSHLDLPVIHHTPLRMDSLELYPFKEMIKAGVGSVMVAHLYLPGYDATPNRASTLSPVIVDSLLRKTLGFKGLIFTDALNMKGVSKFYKSGEAELASFIAGNDVLLFSDNVRIGKAKLRAALDSGIILESQLDEKVMRILAMKHSLGLAKSRTTDLRQAYAAVQSEEGKALKQEIYRKALTLASDPQNQIPLSGNTRIGYIQISGKAESPFYKTLKRFGSVTQIPLTKDELENMSSSKAKQLAMDYDYVIVGIMGMERSAARKFGLKGYATDLVKRLHTGGARPVVSVFGNPYALQSFTNDYTLLVGYDEEPESQIAMAEGILGIIPISGRLPVGAGSFKAGSGHVRGSRPPEDALPSEMGMKSSLGYKIDSVVSYYIQQQAMPGCAVLVRYKGKIVHARGYGHLKYGAQDPVSPVSTLYDLASVTKVAGTTLAFMKLYELGRIHPDSIIGTYLPWLKGGGVYSLKIRQLLTHTSGLPAYLSAWPKTQLPGKVWKPWVYHTEQTEQFPIVVASGMYQSGQWIDSMRLMIKEAKISSQPQYVYSDLGMILTGWAVESVSGMRLDSFLQAHFWNRMGLNTMCYNPWQNSERARYCAPTESDKVWRKQEVKGYVHDQNAAMLGGIAGHAGMFSNLTDLGNLMGMLLDGGVYKGDTLLRQETITYFTVQQKGSKRGLGWDKPDGQPPASAKCGSATFGHTGFTGTCVWADPDHDLLFIFLSNRTYPDPENKLLIREKVRTRIHDIIYQSIN